ncbi:MAG: metalloregulator ArsR/SmtB family transcription factor [Pseudomonadota bacterium]
MEPVQAAAGFSAMGSESRLEVLRILVRAGETGLAVGDIQARTEIPASTLAHHLKFLTSAGLIEQEKSGRTIINRAQFDHLHALADFILKECCADQSPTEQQTAE